MSSEDLAKFKSITDKVNKKEITVEQGLDSIKDIDFNQFSIEDIEAVQDADWLPDEAAVNILKGWMRLQDQILLELRAYLVLTPEITKETLISFVEAAKIPAKAPSLTIDNVIYKIATAGTNDPAKFKNPIEFGLIGAENTARSRDTSDEKKADLYKIFHQDPKIYYTSKPEEHSGIIFALPPFLKIQVEKYQLGCPQTNSSAKGGLRSWILQVSNDPSASNWKTIALKDNDSTFKDCQNKTAVFDVDDPNAGFYRYIHLISSGPNQLGNISMILKNFDVSGKLIISKD